MFRTVLNTHLFHVRRALTARNIALTATAIVFMCCCGLRVYSNYMVHRAFPLLSEATSIKVGNSEGSVLGLVARYDGSKWFPSSSFTEGNTINIDRISNNANLKDYAYDIRLSPFQSFSMNDGEATRFQGALAFLMSHMPNYLRDPIGLRDWLVEVGVRIHEGRVISVSGSAFVEGRTGWLGNSWKQSSEIPKDGGAPSAYSIDTTILEFPPAGGLGIKQTLTPLATIEQVQNSYSFNDHCFTGLIPCASLCDFKPGVFKYLKAHPEVRGNFETDYCSAPHP